MNKKNITKIVLDIVMAVLFISFFNKNLISLKFHMISGVVFGIFILIHMILNRKWIYNISIRLFDKKINLRTKLSYIISLILFISIMLILFSGIYIIKEKGYDRGILWKIIHFGASYLSIALIGIHIGLCWTRVMDIFRKVFKIKSSIVIKLISLLFILVIFTFVFYTIYNDTQKTSLIDLLITYGSITSVFSILTYYIDKSLRKSKKAYYKSSKISA